MTKDKPKNRQFNNLERPSPGRAAIGRVQVAGKRRNKARQKNTEEYADYSYLPYRPGVGMMIVNRNNEVFVGRRVDSRSNGWQMPQGGIDLGETPSSAALREMQEEIGSAKGQILAESKKWYSYRLPPFMVPKLWDGKYCGQKQKWFLIEYIGSDEEINIKTDVPEFESWKWVPFDDLPRIIIPFKRKLYHEVLSEFRDIIKSLYQNRNSF